MTVPVVNKIPVRRLAVEDLPLLERMYDSYAPLGATLGLPPCDPKRRKKWLEDLRTGINLVACVDGALAGHLVLLAGGDALEMVAFVHQDFRRMGIATAMTKAAIEEARLGGFSKVWLLIAKTNIAAQRGLQKLGFGVDWEDRHEIQFSYRLAGRT